MNKNEPFPVTGNVTTIDQVDRIQTYLDNKAIDCLGWVAGSLDVAQQGITTVAGTVLKNLHNRLKKELQRQGRIISKFQKKLDFAGIDNQAIAESDKQELDSILDNAPIEIPEIDNGIIPSIFQTDTNISSSNSPMALGIVSSIGNVPQIRTNPTTCEYEVSDDGITWRGTGNLDQSCIAAKNGTGGGGGGGSGGGGGGGSICQFPPNANIQYVVAQLCNSTMPDTFVVQFTQSVYDNLSTALVPKWLFRYNETTHEFFNDTDYHIFGGGNAINMPGIINLPFKRTREDNYSPYSEEGEWLVRNSWSGYSMSELSSRPGDQYSWINQFIRPFYTTTVEADIDNTYNPSYMS